MDTLQLQTKELVNETYNEEYKKGDLERDFKEVLLLLIDKFQYDKESAIITTIKYLQKQYKNGSFEQASDKLIYLIEGKKFKEIEIYDNKAV